VLVTQAAGGGQQVYEVSQPDPNTLVLTDLSGGTLVLRDTAAAGGVAVPPAPPAGGSGAGRARSACACRARVPRIALRRGRRELFAARIPRLVDDSRCRSVGGIKACYAGSSQCYWEGGDRCTSKGGRR